MDSLPIIAPLLVLAVVLLFGFAGCFTKPPRPEDPEPPATGVTFRARVPNSLELLAPGVRFVWRRSGATTDESATVSTPTAVVGADNFFDHRVPAAEDGIWMARCEMAVRADGQIADAASDFPFTADFVTLPQIVVSFRAQGSPVTQDFTVVADGVTPA